MRSNKSSFLSLTARLIHLTSTVKWQLVSATLSSIIGNASHLSLMGCGAMLLMSFAGKTTLGSAKLWGILMALSALAIVICRYIEGLTSHEGAYHLLADMRVSMFEKLRVLAPACLIDRQKGDTLSIAIGDIETIESFFAHTIGPIFTVILLPLMTLTLAGMVDTLYIWVLLPLYLLVSVLLPYGSLQLGRKIGRQYRKEVGVLKSKVLESVYGIRDIQIFGVGEEKKGEVLAQTEKINRAAHLMTLHRQLVTSAPSFFIYLARILIIAVATYLTVSGRGDPVGVIVLSFVVSASFSSSQTLTSVVTSLLETYAAAERLFELEDTIPVVQEDPDPVELGTIEKIEFRNVTFRYSETSKNVMEHMNLTIQPGDKIGIVGASGIGKSTIIRLLLRFWEPTEGEILINDIPLKKISLKSLRNHIALLEQDTFIFSDSIRDNIAFGKPDATQEEIETAARRAGIHDFIQTLPDGYDTHMGELGGRLSGGEKQRIGIARVMLVDPDMLVMDEPTSSLDILNEKGLLKTLDDEYQDKMIMLVSHRPSTLTGCNRILRLENGQLHDQAPAETA